MSDIIVYPGNGIYSNSFVNKKDKWVIDPSGALNGASLEGYTYFETHVHPDHFSVSNVKGPLYVAQIGKEYLLDPVSHADVMFRTKEVDYPGFFGSKFLLNGYKLGSGLEHCVNKRKYDNLDIKILNDNDVNCSLTAMIVGGHTPDSTVFSFVEDKKLKGFGGDIVYRDRKSGSFKSRDASYEGVIKSCEYLKNKDFEIMFLGHGSEVVGDNNINCMLINVINYEIDIGQAMLKMGLNGTDLRAIKKELGFESRSDGGYGRPYAFSQFALEKDLMEIKNNKLFTINLSSDAVLNALKL